MDTAGDQPDTPPPLTAGEMIEALRAGGDAELERLRELTRGCSDTGGACDRRQVDRRSRAPWRCPAANSPTATRAPPSPISNHPHHGIWSPGSSVVVEVGITATFVVV